MSKKEKYLTLLFICIEIIVVTMGIIDIADEKYLIGWFLVSLGIGGIILNSKNLIFY